MSGMNLRNQKSILLLRLPFLADFDEDFKRISPFIEAEGLLNAHMVMDNSLGHFYTYWEHLESTMSAEQLEDLLPNADILELMFEDFDNAVFSYLTCISSNENVRGIINGDYYADRVFKNGEVLFRRNDAD